MACCELELEKACEHVNGKFLLYLLKRSGFGEKWRAWLAHCISTMCFSVLVDSVLFGFFSSSCGLR
jgi:hypothetical protein